MKQLRMFGIAAGLIVAGIVGTGALALAGPGPASPFDEAAPPAKIGNDGIGMAGAKALGGPVDFAAGLAAGAGYLRHAQADITEDNAGNGTDGVDETPNDPDDGGWDWRLTAPAFTHSTAASPTNIYGATAQGALRAYLATPSAALLTALTDAAGRMAANASIRAAADIVFLMRFDDLAAGTTYQDAARAKYDARIAAYGTAAALAAYIRDARNGQGYPNGIIGWDIGAWAVAAQMLDDRYPGNGYGADADAIAEVLWQDSFNDSPGYFDVVDDKGFDPAYADADYWWYNLGITGLIDAFRISGSHTAEIPGLVAILLAGQHSDGGMDDSYGVNPDNEDWQATAYAALTLADLDLATYQPQISRLAYFLGATQDASGGWVYSTGNHYLETSGECTAALSYGAAPANALVDDGFASQAEVDVYNAAHGTSFIFGYDAFATVQAAIDAVEGSTVTVLDGIYEEQIEITSDLVLTGAGVGSTIIRSPVDLPLGFNTGTSTKYAVVYVHDGAAPTISDLTVDGYGRGNLNVQFVGIGFWNAGGTVADVHVTGVRDTPFSGAQHGVSIYAYNNTGGPYQVALADVLVDDIQKNALALIGTGLTVDLDRVTTIGAGPTGVTAQNGIQISGGAGGTVDDCVVDGFHWTGATWSASGILLSGAAPVAMTGVTINASQTGGYFYNTSLTFTGGGVTNPAGDGLLLYNTDSSKSLPRRQASPFDGELAGKSLGGAKALATSVISGAALSGAGVVDMSGIYAYAVGDIDVDISGCTIGGWDYGVIVYEDGGAITGEAHGNVIAGNLSLGAYSNTAVDYDMTGNWWGHTSGPLHATLNPLGQGNEVSDHILFDPWLGAGGLALQPASSRPIMCGDTVTLAFHYAPDGYTPALRGYEVTFRAGAPVSFGAGDIVDSGILGTLGDDFFYVMDNGDGTFTVTGAILGPTAGLAAAADLFSVTFHGAATGTALVEVTNARLRDLVNDPIGTITAEATIEVDCTPPGPVTGIDAETGHQKVVVTWTDPASDVAAVEVWRSLWYYDALVSVYPEYDDQAGNTVPARPASRAAAAASGEWVLVAAVPAGTETYTDGVMPRGLYYYELFPMDTAGNYGPPAAANDSALNYWLGDVFPAGTYDGLVDVGDITVLGAAFATVHGGGAYNNHCDVGPTSTNLPDGVPLTDNRIDLEDLMIFALNYGVVGPAKSTPAPAGPLALAWAPVDETRWALRLVSACPNLKGLRLTVPLPEGIEATVTAGDLTGRQTALVFLHGAGGAALDVNLAIMGAGIGFEGTGDLFVVDLSAPAVLGGAKIDARGLRNEKLEPTVTAELPTPAVFSLAQNAPNPFNPSTRIVFSLAETRPVRLAVYGIDGRLVRNLLHEQRGAGRHEVVWDGRDDGGRTVASGTYFCRIEAGSWLETRKMVLMK